MAAAILHRCHGAQFIPGGNHLVRRFYRLLGAFALLAGCAGCAGGSHDALPPEATAPPTPVDYKDAVRSAVAASRNTSEQVNETIVITGNGSTYTLTVAGSFDMAADKGALIVRLPGGAIDHMDEVFDGPTIYLRGLSNLGQKWAKTVRSEAQAHYLLRAPLNDPEFVLQQISAIDQVSKGAAASIGGVSTTHYSGNLGQAPLTLRMALTIRQQVAAMSNDLGGADADVWVDPAGRVVRTRTSFNQGETSVTVTMTLSGIGHPVTVAVPTAQAVAPATSISGILPG
ncbi:hypothetical protein [Streptomyces sp. NBC_01198]|uniref:hypothetical protein n=1 Tax=Streptomyces sp. NBC_01198 TaxID=2903769 RepID=UPI002E101A48|nr:hypothetical protein OG702_04325 [Streptomyces sp. NBC_01198]